VQNLIAFTIKGTLYRSGDNGFKWTKITNKMLSISPQTKNIFKGITNVL
jgi:Sortilin, neurotensin receptor 3,